ncbi:cleft lip and palate transmembrane protein 1 homolog [Anoplophora glabripennis]|uniref:cleft lip and palate transmembrane protein 1 homolog n=1 Tax=Anoplophora glabripennis TaxID=217634 RepID=UPI000873D0C4|nr:cleft lip and palate transmembrane protein 1 homolog [Anoplophora glabripennis]
MSEMKNDTDVSVSNNTVATQRAIEGSPNTENQNGQPTELQRQPSKLESFFGIVKSLIIRGIIIYFISSFFRGPQAPKVTEKGTQVTYTPARNIFQEGTVLNLYIYLSENETVNNYHPSNLFWYKEGLTYGDWSSGPNGDGTYFIEKSVPVTPNMRNNGSLFLHAFLTRSGYSPDPKAENYARNQMSSVMKQLNRYKKLKSSGTKNLLTGESEKIEVEDGKVISHWHPNFTINLVTDQTSWTYGSVPAPLDQYIRFSDDRKFYKPVLFANDFWNMARDYKPLNDSLSLQITFQPLSLFKWQLYAAQHTRQMWNIWGDNEPGQSDEEQDTLKETLLDTNPYLLGITVLVSIVHSVFELLAFKNDIQFWNNRNSLEGLSVRSVFFGVFQSLVVLLYVLDNETNTLIRISCFVGLGIEFWKIWKVVDIKFENGRLTFKDKSSYVESSTKVYDKLAFKYLSWVCFPLLAGYSVYALLYLEHKGWYSFVLDLLYGYLLTFGFIMMTPQLFINYKLQSVAHLPWRMLTYKFLNTFIDDMFAFVIKMPTMYRIGCFRDDIVFLIFLYQRWIYPVDKTRRNEFGYSGEQEENQKSITEGQDQSAIETKKDK